MKLGLIAVGLLISSPAVADALNSPMLSWPQKPDQQQNSRNNAPTTIYSVAPSLPCVVPDHLRAVCFWQDPGAQECYPDLLGGPKGYPARHYFDGRTVCWAGDQRFFAVVKP